MLFLQSKMIYLSMVSSDKMFGMFSLSEIKDLVSTLGFPIAIAIILIIIMVWLMIKNLRIIEKFQTQMMKLVEKLKGEQVELMKKFQEDLIKVINENDKESREHLAFLYEFKESFNSKMDGIASDLKIELKDEMRDLNEKINNLNNSVINAHANAKCKEE